MFNKAHSAVGSCCRHLHDQLKSDAMRQGLSIIRRVVKRMGQQQFKAAAVAIIEWCSNWTDFVDGRKLMMRIVAKLEAEELSSVCARWKEENADFKKNRWKMLEEKNHNLETEIALLRQKLKTSNDELGELEIQVLVQSSTA